MAPPGMPVFHDIVIDSQKIGGTIAIVEGHDLFDHKVCLAQHILVDQCFQTKFFLQIGNGGQGITLPVGADGGSELNVENVGSCLGGGSHAGDKQAVRVMAVIMQHEFGPAAAQRPDKLLHEARRAEAGHILETENNVAGCFGLSRPHDGSHHIKRGFGYTKVVLDIKPLCP